MHPKGSTLVQQTAHRKAATTREGRQLFANTTMDAIIVAITPESVASAICDALMATLKDGTPDHRTRIEGAKLFLNYSVGLPVQRTETIDLTPKESPKDIMDRLLANPAARAVLRQILDERA